MPDDIDAPLCWRVYAVQQTKYIGPAASKPQGI